MLKLWLASSIILLVSLSVFAESGYAYRQQVVSLQSKLEDLSKAGLKQQLPRAVRRRLVRQIIRLRIQRRPDITTISNPKLRNAIDNLFRREDQAVPGGTAGAIIFERITGRFVGGRSHIIKGQQRVQQLQRILQQESLSPQERRIAQNILDDLLDSLNFNP